MVRNKENMFSKNGKKRCNCVYKCKICTEITTAQTTIPALGHNYTSTIVTAPTCGACAVLPSVLAYMQDKNKYTDDQILRALPGIFSNTDGKPQHQLFFLFLDDWNTVHVCQAAQSGGVIEVLEHHDEFDGIAPHTTAEAMERLASRVHMERGRFFTVERAAGFPGIAGAAQLQILAEELHDIRGVLDACHAFLGNSSHIEISLG